MMLGTAHVLDNRFYPLKDIGVSRNFECHAKMVEDVHKIGLALCISDKEESTESS